MGRKRKGQNESMKCAREKGYAEPYRDEQSAVSSKPPYLADGRPIWLIGLSFDSATRRLVDCAAEQRGDADVAV